MLYDRMQSFSASEINLLHHASMHILAENGLAFSDEEALSLFKHHGFKVSGRQVYIHEKDVFKALETAPSRFRFTGRNPDRAVWIGGDDFIYVPTYGAPFVVEPDGTQRSGFMADYEKAAKLVHNSPAADISGLKYLAPGDIPSDTAYLDMLKANLTFSDKPSLGATDSLEAADHTMELMEMVYGEKYLDDHFVAMGLINPLSPLAFASEMSGCIIKYARRRQPLIILNMILAGASGPVRLPSLMALVNAEILGGVILAQLAGPGTPLIYGTTSCPIFMKTGGAETSSPETMWISSAIMQLARFYGLPCRTGGALTDSLRPDAQAMAEGALNMMNTVRGGAHFILHSLGMIGGFIGFSFEKWIMDEEICALLRDMTKQYQITPETLDVKNIIDAGSGGSYLARPETVKQCRKAFYPHHVFNKLDEAGWRKEGAPDIVTRTKKIMETRLAEYQAPDMAPGLAKDIAAFVSRIKKV